MSLPNFKSIEDGFKYDATGSAGTTTTINEGDLLLLTSDGWARPASTPVAGEKLLGFAAEYLQHSGAAGSKKIAVKYGHVKLLATGTVNSGSIRQPVYVHNATSVAVTSALTGANVQAGVVSQLADSTHVWVELLKKDV